MVESVLARPGSPGAAKVIALSNNSAKEYVLKMLKAGALAHIIEGDTGHRLLPAIHAVLKQQTYLCPLAEAAVVNTRNAYA